MRFGDHARPGVNQRSNPTRGGSRIGEGEGVRQPCPFRDVFFQYDSRSTGDLPTNAPQTDLLALKCADTKQLITTTMSFAKNSTTGRLPGRPADTYIGATGGAVSRPRPDRSHAGRPVGDIPNSHVETRALASYASACRQRNTSRTMSPAKVRSRVTRTAKR